MSAGLTVSIISAVVALTSILLSARAARSNTKFQSELQGNNDAFKTRLEAQLQRDNEEFKSRLQEEIQERRDQISKAERLEEVVSRYRDPLLSAAFELQSRIYNLVRLGFTGYILHGDDDEKNYAVKSTLFVIAQYLAWSEALRRGVQFLDLGDIERSRELASRLEEIRSAFSTDTKFQGPFRIFRTEQRAIGELMLEPNDIANQDGVPWQCVGYAEFCSRIEREQGFAPWFARLDRDIRAFPSSKDPDRERLAPLQNRLMDLVDFLDNPPLRLPLEMRSRIP
jgi:hypothetical protein